MWNFLCQAEDGIRDVAVTGVQTCALPIFDDARETAASRRRLGGRGPRLDEWDVRGRRARERGEPPGARRAVAVWGREIGRASCRERVGLSGEAVSLKLQSS